jgi:chromate transporter
MKEMMSKESIMAAPNSAQRHVSFTEALRFCVKLGFISFGGPAGQIAIMHSELVEQRRPTSKSSVVTDI